MTRRGLALGSWVISLLLAASPARADAIDGQWCLGAKSFVIDGPNIRTPSGIQLSGSYDRHGFEYVVPAGEPDAGMQIVMLLVNEEAVRLTRGSAVPPEIWRRCKPIS
jgi:hypothetical protein